MTTTATNLTPEQTAEAIRWLRGYTVHCPDLKLLFADAADALESLPALAQQVAQMREALTTNKEAHAALVDVVARGGDKDYREFCLAESQAQLTQADAALALPTTAAEQQAREHQEKAELLDQLSDFEGSFEHWLPMNGHGHRIYWRGQCEEAPTFAEALGKTLRAAKEASRG